MPSEAGQPTWGHVSALNDTIMRLVGERDQAWNDAIEAAAQACECHLHHIDLPDGESDHVEFPRKCCVADTVRRLKRGVGLPGQWNP